MALRVALLAVLCCGIFTAQEPKKDNGTDVARQSLKWKLEKDKAILQELTIKGEGTMFGENGLNAELAMKFTCTESNGKKMKLLTRITRLKAETEGMLQIKLDYADGEWKEATIGVPIQEEGADPAEKIKEQIEKTITITLSANGETEFDEDIGPQGFSEIIGGGRGMPPSIGLRLPEKEVKEGDSWEAKDENDNTLKFKWEKTEKVDDMECALITISGETENETGFGTAKQSIDAKYWFAIKEGYIVKATVKTSQSMEMQGGNGMETKMELSLRTKTTEPDKEEKKEKKKGKKNKKEEKKEEEEQEEDH